MAEVSPAQDSRLNQIVTRNFNFEKESFGIGLRRRENDHQYCWRNCLNGVVSVPENSNRWLKTGNGIKLEPNYDGHCVLKNVGYRRGYVDYDCNQNKWFYNNREIGDIYALCESGTWRPGRQC